MTRLSLLPRWTVLKRAQLTVGTTLDRS